MKKNMWQKQTAKKQKDAACTAADQLLFSCCVISRPRMRNYPSSYANDTLPGKLQTFHWNYSNYKDFFSVTYSFKTPCQYMYVYVR